MPSEIDETARARSELPEAVVRAQLDRILTSQVFSRSQQLRRFLAFIVEQQLAGHGHSIKESVLAHELYGKGTDFDGGADPVVRVDARRLRDKLREFYDGRSEPIVISLPKGSYVPVFEANSESSAQTAPPVALAKSQQAEPQGPTQSPGLRRATLAVGALAVIAGVVAAVLIWRTLRTPASTPAELI